MTQKLDTQQVEIVGRNLLTSIFVAEGFEVATPLRDRGIDLIIYDDMQSHRFWSVPVQLKAASMESFSIDRKYEKIPKLLIAYVWHAKDPLNATVYIMTYAQAVEVAKLRGYTDSPSWQNKGKYVNNKPGDELSKALKKYKYQPGLLKQSIN